MYQSLEQHFYANVRNEFLTQRQKSGFTPAVIHGVLSHPGRALGFFAVLQNGANYGPLPVTALCKKRTLPEPLHHLQLWDCFNAEIHCHTYSLLDGASVRVRLPGREGAAEWRSGNYVTTFGWGPDGGDIREPTQFKTANLIELSNGNYCLQPNNRVLFDFPHFTEVDTDNPPRLMVTDRVYSSEGGEHRWQLKDDTWNYEVQA